MTCAYQAFQCLQPNNRWAWCKHIYIIKTTNMVPSCNQTWQWETPLNARFNGKRSVNEGCSKIMHPQGKPLQLAEKTWENWHARCAGVMSPSPANWQSSFNARPLAPQLAFAVCLFLLKWWMNYSQPILPEIHGKSDSQLVIFHL